MSTSPRVARVAALGAGLLAAWPAPAQLPFPEVSAAHVQAWQGPPRRAVLVDCRTAAEYEQGHIPGAVNLPPGQVQVAAARLPADRAATLIFYCRGGG